MLPNVNDDHQILRISPNRNRRTTNVTLPIYTGMIIENIEIPKAQKKKCSVAFIYELSGSPHKLRPDDILAVRPQRSCRTKVGEI